MPIDYKKYPKDWKQISKRIIEKQGNCCGLCPAVNGGYHWKTGSKVILTTHHIDFNINNNDPKNLIGLCQRCHLRLDMAKKIEKRKKQTRMKI